MQNVQVDRCELYTLFILALVLQWGSPTEAALPYNNTNPRLNQVSHLHPSNCRYSDVCPEFLQLSHSHWLSASSTPLVPSTRLHKIYSTVPIELGTFSPTNSFSIHVKTDSVILKMKAVCSSKCQNKPFLYAMKPPKRPPPPPSSSTTTTKTTSSSSSSSSQSLSLSKGYKYEIRSDVYNSDDGQICNFNFYKKGKNTT